MMSEIRGKADKSGKQGEFLVSVSVTGESAKKYESRAAALKGYDALDRKLREAGCEILAVNSSNHGDSCYFMGNYTARLKSPDDAKKIRDLAIEHNASFQILPRPSDRAVVCVNILENLGDRNGADVEKGYDALDCKLREQGCERISEASGRTKRSGRFLGVYTVQLGDPTKMETIKSISKEYGATVQVTTPTDIKKERSGNAALKKEILGMIDSVTKGSK